ARSAARRPRRRLSDGSPARCAMIEKENPPREVEEMAISETGYQMCVRTVMDTTDPEIWFDEDGVSSHAHFYDEHVAPVIEAAESGAAAAELQGIVETI